MDQMELRSGKTLAERGVNEDSDNDPEEDLHTLLDGYTTGVFRKEKGYPGKAGRSRPRSPPTPSSIYNGHFQCPLSTDVSDDVGRFDIYPRPLLAGTDRRRYS